MENISLACNELYYRAARDELVTRIKLRNTLIINYIAGIAALFTFTFSFKNYMILYIMPYFALAFSLLYIQHNIAISALNNYLTTELLCIGQWDNSRSLAMAKPIMNQFRVLGVVVLYITPTLFSEVILFIVNKYYIFFHNLKYNIIHHSLQSSNYIFNNFNLAEQLQLFVWIINAFIIVGILFMLIRWAPSRISKIGK